MANGIDTHPAEDLLRSYALGHLGEAELLLVEPHVDECSRCRERLAHCGVSPVVNRNWDRLAEAIDVTPSSMAERLLLRLGVPDHVAKLMAAVPALRASWLAASALLLLFAALVTRLLQPDGASDLFAVAAPLLPIVGVALCFDNRWDPARDMALVAPLSTFRLALMRTAVVLGTCVALSTAAALTLPGFGLDAFAWLLPSCALTALSLLLSTRLNGAAVCAVVGGGWTVLALLTRNSPWVASGQGQLSVVAALLMFLLLLVPARSAFDIQRKVSS